MGGRDKTFSVACVRENSTYGVNDFSDNGDGTITDNATGLIWSQNDSGSDAPDGLNWEEALAYVEAQNEANYLGYSDWRLPSVKELQSIVDYDRSPDTTNSAGIDPLFNATIVPNEDGEVDYDFYWTGTTHANWTSDSGNAGAYVSFGRGLGYMGGSIETKLRLRSDEPDSLGFDPTLTLDVGAITIPVEIDSRDDQLFPRDGWLVAAKGVFYRESLGSDFDAETFKISANHYLPVGERDVLASRVVVKSSSEGTPFFLVSSFGGSVDLRGYPSGRYRDDKVYAVQSEYRWHFRDRWILSGFAGFGEVAESLSDFGENFLPAAGVGLRYVLSAEHKVSLSMDVATGKDGTEFYFGVGEAF